MKKSKQCLPGRIFLLFNSKLFAGNAFSLRVGSSTDGLVKVCIFMCMSILLLVDHSLGFSYCQMMNRKQN
jgi:hypothetical protein